jgi:hypothetical protein
MWMWAAVAVMPVVFTLPVITLSPTTVMVLTPDAWVFTAGTSCEPLRTVSVVAASL